MFQSMEMTLSTITQMHQRLALKINSGGILPLLTIQT
jgi:hypothetical protein